MPRKAKIPDFRSLVPKIAKAGHEALVREVRTFTTDERKRFRRRIERQNFTAFDALPLSPNYLRRKELAGADLRTMIATGHYLRNIRIKKTVEKRRSEEDKVTYEINVPEDARAMNLKRRLTDFPLRTAIEVQEFGSEKAQVPPRPHWGPHFDDMRIRLTKHRKKMRRRIAKHIQRRVGSKIVVKVR